MAVDEDEGQDWYQEHGGEEEDVVLLTLPVEPFVGATPVAVVLNAGKS